MATTLPLTNTFSALQKSLQEKSRVFDFAKPVYGGAEDTSAVRTSLSKADESASPLQKTAAGGAGGKSLLGSFLDEISDVSAKLLEVAKRIAESPPGSEGATSLRSEQEALQNEYKRITAKTDEYGQKTAFGKLSESLEAVSFQLQSGASAASLAGGIDRVGVGDDFLQLLRAGQGDLARSISDSVSFLASEETRGSLDNLDVLAKIQESIENVKGSLRVSRYTTALTKDQTPQQVLDNLTQPLTFERLSFEGASGLSIGLVSASGENLLKAAAVGLNYDPAKALVLLIDDGRNVSTPQIAGFAGTDQRNTKY